MAKFSLFFLSAMEEWSLLENRENRTSKMNVHLRKNKLL
jgi:hypothetical protein